MASKRNYPIIRLLIKCFYALAIVALAAGIGVGVCLWIYSEASRDGIALGGPLNGIIGRYAPAQLAAGAALSAGIGLIGFFLFGAVGQVLAMQRDCAIHSFLQTQLLEDILELNEEVARSARTSRVDLCEGCGRLGSLHRIDSGQWVCRECHRQLRSA